MWKGSRGLRLSQPLAFVLHISTTALVLITARGWSLSCCVEPPQDPEEQTIQSNPLSTAKTFHVRDDLQGELLGEGRAYRAHCSD